ncbi:MAG: YggS family pyridoxal phosphate-dependent enzyme [Planctomycetes bacterium]|nr:YggS family pyridoxal phosphate-dependent enzyme [Planctomycetota bacterium]
MISSTTQILSDNLQRIRERIEAACARAGRSRNEVTLIAVTKYAELDWVRALIDLGMTELGESRPQQLVSRAAELPAHIHWHMIGHLQRNKVDTILPVVSRIHSVDSVRLVEAIQKSARKLGVRPRVLLEVNVSGEQSKDGFDPTELMSAWPMIQTLDSIAVEGLMTMAPLNEQVESARPVFQELARFRNQLIEASEGLANLPDLSMGMSGDFEIGIDEGATLIRVGSSLFEGLSRE